MKDAKTLAAEWKSDDSEELNRVYAALGIAGDMSPSDEITRMRAEVERLTAERDEWKHKWMALAQLDDGEEVR